MFHANHDNWDIEEIKRKLIEQQDIDSNNAKSTLNFQHLREYIPNNDYFEYVVNSIKKTVMCEDVLIKQILYTGFSSYTEDPINLGILAPTSEGKTYVITESLQYFPDKDVIMIGQMSTMALVRQRGTIIDEKGEPIEHKINEIKKKTTELRKKNKENKDGDKKAKINEQIEKYKEEMQKLYEGSKTLIDLRGKILAFLEPPNRELWNLLKPILSHDKKEIEFPFVNKTERNGHETKNVVVRGWSSCIFCSARDESKWEIWSEIQSRFLITSPNMITEKYQKSNELISLRKGLPNLIQQQVIISDKEIEIAKDCVLSIKQKIQDLSSKNKDGKISTWIPYRNLLEKELPAKKGTDVRFAKRIYSLLNVIPIVKHNLRKILILCGETSVIAEIDDLREVLSITQNFEGIPRYKMDFFNDIFYPLYKSKSGPDSNKDATKTEDKNAVTTRQLCDYFKEVRNKPISIDTLKKTYLNELINNEIIDYEVSKIDAKQFIYFSLVEPYFLQKNNEETEAENSLSLLSKPSHFDNDSQQCSSIYQKISQIITEEWIFSETMRLFCYRNDVTKIAGPFADYLNSSQNFQLLDNYIISRLNEDQAVEQQESMNIKNGCMCITLKDRGGKLTIREFTKKYKEISQSHFDNKQTSNIASFGKISPIISNLANFDKKDNNTFMT